MGNEGQGGRQGRTVTPRRGRTPVRCGTCARRLAGAVFLLIAVGAAQASARGREVVVRAGGEGAAAQPMVGFELRAVGSGRPLTPGKDEVLGGLLDGVPTVAILDTGASGSVISGPTAARFAVDAEHGSRYVEVGMAGEHAMAVSRPYTLALCNDDATEDGTRAPGSRRPRAGARRRRARAGCDAALVLSAQRFLLNEPNVDLAALLTSPGTAVDVVGMPAIASMVVELRPASEAGVRLHPRGARVPADLWIPLDMVDFNRRRHPKNRGPLPTLAVNPMVRGVRAVAGSRSAAGDWLLDTGSAVTILSSPLARRLGLVDGRGKPLHDPDFTLPVGGIGGGQRPLPGFRIDRLELDAEDGTTLVIDEPSILVHDVVATDDGGTAHRLDGILGMNVLGVSGSGMSIAGFSRTYAAAFERVVIDAPRRRLGVTPAR
jgi:hypothetical protein